MTKCLTIDIFDDDVLEGNHSIMVGFHEDESCPLLVEPLETVIVIIDDEGKTSLM